MRRRLFFVTIIIIISFLAISCATNKNQVQDLKTQVGVLEHRINTLEKTQEDISRSSAQQIESVGYLKGKVEGSAQPKEYIIKEYSKDANEGYLYKDEKVKGIKLTKKQIQKALKNAGFYQGPIDGVIGKQTRRAIKEFQEANDLKADGIAGSKTCEKLTAYLQ